MSSFLGRQLVVISGVWLLAMGIQLGALLAASALFTDEARKLTAWYAGEWTIAAVLVTAMVVAYRFWAFVIARLGDVVGPIIGAVVSASVVPAAQYLMTGSLSLTPAVVAGAAGSAAAGAIGTALGNAVQRRGGPRSVPGAAG